MLWMPSYHIIDNFIPPTVETDKDLQETLLRHENVSACATLRDSNKCKILSNGDKTFHLDLWKAYLRDEYYSNRDDFISNVRSNKLKLSDMPELLYHWPEEEFVLKEIMPVFPAKLSWFSLPWHECKDEYTPFQQNEDYLDTFYSKVIDIIFMTFTELKSKDVYDAHKSVCKIKSLNISGIMPIGHENFFLNQMSEFSHKGPRCRFVDNSSLNKVVPYGNPFLKCDEKLEIILNTEVFFDEEISQDQAATAAAPPPPRQNNYKYSNIIFRGGDVLVHGHNFTDFAVQVIGKSINKETKSMQLGIVSITELLKLMNMIETSTEQICISYFELRGFSNPPGGLGGVNSLKFLPHLKNLEHLNILKSNLQGKLEPLLRMEKGLRFLCLKNCNIKYSDLDVLSRSKHRSSLLELNLSHNNLDKNSEILINLVQKLQNVIILNFEKCMLEKLSDSDLCLLCDSINNLQHLSHLNLTGNHFSMDIITSHLTSLRASPSLRLLEMMMPLKETQTKDLQGSAKEIYAAQKNFSKVINTTINDGRLQLLYVDFGMI